MGTEEQFAGGDRFVPSRELILAKEWWQAVSRLSLLNNRDMTMTSMTLTQIEALLDWKTGKRNEGRHKMQDQITIELRVDFADKEKIPELIKIACSMARTLVANVQLLGPTCKPECVVFTDNFMSAPQQINIYDDLIGMGQEQLAKISGATATVTADEPSAEMLAALKGGV